ncbi:MAG: ArsA family ATPase [Candidatus Schekmanbacteria bacterium]|nr:ArsA family ATPase [Candidatus Schekmanbacteria bacterium]
MTELIVLSLPRSQERATTHFRRHLMQRRILFFAGSGGVGKTTVAAAAAVDAALRGRRVLAMTIDPARRLADALGIGQIGGEITEVDIGRFRALRSERDDTSSGGRLWALMLDQKRACDELVERLSPTPDVRDRILGNRIYQAASDSLAGTQEYIALGKLYDLQRRPDWDLIVVDTAPTEHAISFFEAPMRLFNVFDSKILTALRMPMSALSRFGEGFIGRSVDAILERVERAIGTSFFRDIGQFAVAVEGVANNFRDRARVIHEILQDPAQTAFGVVCSPQTVSIEEALFIYRRLENLRMNFDFFVVNKVHPQTASAPQPGDGDEETAAAAYGGRMSALLEALRRSYTFLQERHLADRTNIGRLANASSDGVDILEIPFLPHEVCDLDGLLVLGDYLTGRLSPRDALSPRQPRPVAAPGAGERAPDPVST